MNEHTDINAQTKGRMVFLLMLTFFVVPIVVVILMYQFNWKPHGASAGELFKPARLLSVPALQTDASQTIKAEIFHEKWSLVYLADDCTQTCMQKLSDMRQLHVSLYKDIPRTQRVFITNTLATEEIKALFPDMIVINQPKDQIANFVQQFAMNEGATHENETLMQQNNLYIVDPLGHLMMRYQADVPLALVRKDVARLLKYSWAG